MLQLLLLTDCIHLYSCTSVHCLSFCINVLYVCIVISGVQVIYNEHAAVTILGKPDAYLQLVTLTLVLTDTDPDARPDRHRP